MKSMGLLLAAGLALTGLKLMLMPALVMALARLVGTFPAEKRALPPFSQNQRSGPFA